MSVTEHEVLVAEAVLELACHADEGGVLDLLHDLTTFMVTLLEVRGAGTTVMDEAGRVDYLTASDEVCRELEEDQLELDEGPCVDSVRSAGVLAPVALGPGSAGAVRWPRFAPRALRAGFASVAAVPLRAGTHMLGAVNLLSAAPGAPCAQDMRLARILADAAGSWLGHQQLLHTKDELIDQLQTALNTRIVIEQAKGVLAARLGIGVDDAFHRLRSHARSRQQKLSDVAARVASGDDLPELNAPPRHAGG
ncbi:GAF and ANTAR domain-containing protein [Streptomyces sp. NPDC127108]|uniref:GAF and ANTAR domain-containing protein n=1 Tax=Streptomyces sp. NPDC127108 TaxID=3345361 RepID=UPI00364010C7